MNITMMILAAMASVAPGADSTKRIQQAIDEVAAAGGGEVRLEKADYAIDTLKMKSGVTLRGNGAELKCSTTAFEFDGCKGATVEDLEIDFEKGGRLMVDLGGLKLGGHTKEKPVYVFRNVKAEGMDKPSALWPKWRLVIEFNGCELGFDEEVVAAYEGVQTTFRENGLKLKKAGRIYRPFLKHPAEFIPKWAPEFKVEKKKVKIDITTLENVQYRKEFPECKLDFRYPKGKEGFETLVWFHGGGMEIGSRSFIQMPDNNIAQVTVDYRLMCEDNDVRGDDIAMDAAAAVAWALDNVAKYGGDPKKVYMSGISAGGWLTFMVGMNPKYMKAFGHSHRDIAGLVPISGQATSHFRVRYYKEDGKSEYDTMDVCDRLMVHGKYFIPKIDEFAPLNWVGPDISPMVAVCGTSPWDMHARSEENRFLIETCKALGAKNMWFVELPYMDHSGATLCGIPYIQALMRGMMRGGEGDGK